MRELVAAMTHVDPKKRITMDEVVTRFDVILKSLSTHKLRSRVVKQNENPIMMVFRTIGYLTRRASYTLARVPALPRPPPFVHPPFNGPDEVDPASIPLPPSPQPRTLPLAAQSQPQVVFIPHVSTAPLQPKHAPLAA